LRRHVAI